MKKLLSLFLALTMILTMASPALAARRATEEQPSWQAYGYESLEAMLEDDNMDEATYYAYFASSAEQKAWGDAYAAAHPDEAAAFDADAYFTQQYDQIWTKSEYMDAYGFKTEEEFRQKMLILWISEQSWKAEEAAMVDKYTASYPDEIAAFDAIAYFEAHYSYYDSKEEYMTLNNLTTEEEFVQSVLVGYIYDQKAIRDAKDAWAATVAAEPQLTARFLADLDGWINREYYWYGTLDEYMQSNEYSDVEQAYNSLYEMWKYDYEYALRQKAALDARITELGGTPGQINVLVNDKMISFGSAKPVLDGEGSLTVPADVLSKALGIIVKGDANGYAPLRFTAENAGWDVLWDEEYRSAVLINRNGVIGDIDARFSKLNSLYGKFLDLLSREEGQSYKIDETLSLNLTAFNSLDGDKTYTAGIKGTSTVKDGVISASLTLDLAGLVRQLSPELKSAITANLPKKISAGTLVELLSGVKVDVILNPEDGLYIHAPILAKLMDDIDEDTWLYFESPSYYYADEDTAEPVFTSLNIGSLIYADHIYRYSYYSNEIDTYFDMMDAADSLASFLGNDRFTVSGDDISYKLDTKTVNSFVAKATESSYSGPMTGMFRTADVSVNLTGGKLSFKAEVRPNTESIAIDSGYGGPGAIFSAWIASQADFNFKTGGTVTASGSNLAMELHLNNRFKANLSYTSTTQKTNTVPAIEPPADADVVDAYDYLYGFYPYYPYAMYSALYRLIP